MSNPRASLELRKAPYAPVKALQEFLDRIRTISAPERVDRKFLQRIGVARNSEWALLSALKFLGIIDTSGAPGPSYRRLQTLEWRDALRDFVITAYKPLLEIGGLHMSISELRSYFSLEHSASQARNATRFFREVSELAQLREYRPVEAETDTAAIHLKGPPAPEQASKPARSELIAAKRRVLESLPQAAEVEWSAEDYLKVFERVLQILENLDRTLD